MPTCHVFFLTICWYKISSHCLMHHILIIYYICQDQVSCETFLYELKRVTSCYASATDLRAVTGLKSRFYFGVMVQIYSYIRACVMFNEMLMIVEINNFALDFLP